MKVINPELFACISGMKMLWTMRFLAKLSTQIFVTFMTVSKPDSATISACSQRVTPYRSLLHACQHGRNFTKKIFGNPKKNKKTKFPCFPARKDGKGRLKQENAKKSHFCHFFKFFKSSPNAPCYNPRSQRIPFL